MTSALEHGDIVVGVDGSAVSAGALRWAVTEAARSGRSVRAVHAWSFDPTNDIKSAVAEAKDRLATLRRGELETFVRETLDDAETAAVRIELVEGAAAAVLTRAAGDASMLVLGSHGHGMVAQAVVGSVAAQCVRRAACPVVIIPARAAHASVTFAQRLAASTYTPGPIL